MITEYTKPWNSSKVWLDSDKPYTVVLKIPGEAVYKFDEWYDVEFICKHFNIDPREIDEVVEALQKAFKAMDRLQHPFLCSTCEYGYLFRIFHGKSEYICKKKAERKDKEPSPIPLYGDDISILIAPSIYDLENGPGGWDGKSCPNYTKC